MIVHYNRNEIKSVSDLTRATEAKLSGTYGPGEAKAMTRLMYAAVKGWSMTDMIVNGDREASDWLIEKFESILSRLAEGEPLQYIVGEARFYGMDLKVNSSVLIPRQETEELVDLIVRENVGEDLEVLDIGTGSGAIAIALSRNLAFSKVTAIDISGDALEVARENAAQLHARIKFVEADVFSYELQSESYDIIVSNPPYVCESEKGEMEQNVLDYEPWRALFVSDEHPLIYYSRITELAMSGLKKGGRIYFEINPRFAEEIKEMLSSCGFVEVKIIEDISHRPRFATGRKPKGD